MPKTKLTLYVDKDTSKLAKNISKISGKSVSELFSDYFAEKAGKLAELTISDRVQKWVGIIESPKSYKELRDELVTNKIKKYIESK